MTKASTNVRIYKDTHKIIKRLARQHRISLATMIHDMAILADERDTFEKSPPPTNESV